jgi:hypothetical protein
LVDFRAKLRAFARIQTATDNALAVIAAKRLTVSADL